MSRWIDADALIKTLGVSDEDINFMELLQEAPSIDIVRCKECVHRDPEDKKCDCGMWHMPFTTKPDDFCSYGEAKEK